MRASVNVISIFFAVYALIRTVQSQLYAEFLNTENDVFLDETVTLSAVGWGQVATGINAEMLLFCIYESLDTDPHVIRSGEEFVFPRHNACWQPEIDSSGHVNINQSFGISGYIPLTIGYIAVFINTRANLLEDFELARGEIVVDVLDSKSAEFRAAHISDDQRRILTSSVVDIPAYDNAIGVTIFLKDLDVHGANMRLVRFACSVCSSPDKWPIRVAFLLGAFEGGLLRHVSRCRCLIHVAPALTMEVLENAGNSIDIDDSLVHLLSSFDLLLAPNTNGDTQTDVLFGYIELMRNLRLDGKAPRVALDLCNIYLVDVLCRERWHAVVDFLIAPSVFVAQHPTSLDARKRVEVVYPSLSDNFEYSSGTSKPWPRRPNGKFQVGFFSSVLSLRSPGVFVRTVAHLFRSHSAEYIHDNFEFVVVGTGSGLNNTLSLARKLGVDRYIDFVGYVPKLYRDDMLD